MLRTQAREPNTQISGATASWCGAVVYPTPTRGPNGEHSFSGPDIQTLDSALGTKVTVTLEDGADRHRITLTFLIPEMWIAPDAGIEVRTIAIYTTKEEPITAPAGLSAVREQYDVVRLDGAGKLVES